MTMANFQTITENMLLIGCITAIRSSRVRIAMPHGLTASMIIKQNETMLVNVGQLVMCRVMKETESKYIASEEYSNDRFSSLFFQKETYLSVQQTLILLYGFRISSRIWFDLR